MGIREPRRGQSVRGNPRAPCCGQSVRGNLRVFRFLDRSSSTIKGDGFLLLFSVSSLHVSFAGNIGMPAPPLKRQRLISEFMIQWSSLHQCISVESWFRYLEFGCGWLSVSSRRSIIQLDELSERQSLKLRARRCFEPRPLVLLLIIE